MFVGKSMPIADEANGPYAATLYCRPRRFGFTDAGVEALAKYLGHEDAMAAARRWYDG